MGVFAWRNLLTRPLRTVLALVGLSIPILGMLGLFSLSNGLRDLVGTTLSRIEGLIILRENAPSPVFSRLPAGLSEELRRLPGVRAVAPEVWGIAPMIEGKGMLLNGILSGKGINSFLDQPVIAGQDIVAHQNLHSAVFPRALKENGTGRFLEPSDRGQPNAVISRKIARQHPDAQPQQRRGHSQVDAPRDERVDQSRADVGQTAADQAREQTQIRTFKCNELQYIGCDHPLVRSTPNSTNRSVVLISMVLTIPTMPTVSARLTVMNKNVSTCSISELKLAWASFMLRASKPG